MAPPPPPPELMLDLVSEILLRLPPDEPEHLFRASLVCKPWLRAVCDPAFLKRYRAFHGAPPLLGLLHRLEVMQEDPERRLARTTAVPLSRDPTFRRALDCRHGRVLLHASDDDWELIVWDPVTGHQHRLPEPGIPWLIYTAAVLCAVPGCDHLDCHGGPFRVVFMATDEYDDFVKAAMYSSETAAWTTPVSLDDGFQSRLQRYQAARQRGELYLAPYVQPMRCALVGDDVYFTLRRHKIIKYDWGNNNLSTISPPPSPDVYEIALMVMNDGSLGFTCIEDSSLHVWSRKVNSGGAAEWVHYKVIELEKTVTGDEAYVVGSAEGVGVVFVATEVGLFTIKLNSGQVKKVAEPGVYFSVLPYMSFYTPGCPTQPRQAPGGNGGRRPEQWAGRPPQPSMRSMSPRRRRRRPLTLPLPLRGLLLAARRRHLYRPPNGGAPLRGPAIQQRPGSPL